MQRPGPLSLRLKSALRPRVQQKSLINEMWKAGICQQGGWLWLCVGFPLFLNNPRMVNQNYCLSY